MDVHNQPVEGSVAAEHLRTLAVPELHTSCGSGEASSENVYRAFGFVPPGERYGDEIELVYPVAPVKKR